MRRVFLYKKFVHCSVLFAITKGLTKKFYLENSQIIIIEIITPSRNIPNESSPTLISICLPKK